MKITKSELKKIIKATLVEEAVDPAGSIKEQINALRLEKKALQDKKKASSIAEKKDAQTYKVEYAKWLEAKQAESDAAKEAGTPIKRKDWGDKYPDLKEDYMAIYNKYKSKYGYERQRTDSDIKDVTKKIAELQEQAKSEKAAAGGKVNITVNNVIAHKVLSDMLKANKLSDYVLRIFGIGKDGSVQLGPQSSAKASIASGYGSDRWPKASEYYYSDYGVDQKEFVRDGNAVIARIKKLVKSAIKLAQTTDDLDALAKAFEEVANTQGSKDTQARETASRNRPMSDEEYGVANEMISKYGNKY